MKLILLGPQASGKGTQSEMLARELGLHHIAVGERFRQEIAAGTHLGKMIKDKLDKGEMVDDKLVESLVKKLLQEAHSHFVLDGFPRDAQQAAWLDDITDIDKVFVLRITDKAAVERIGGRRECAKGHDFHVTYNPPKKEGICDECGLPLKRRVDDTSVAIMKRLHLYHEQTEPVLSHYKGKIVEIDGTLSIKDVHFAILKGLHKHG